METGPPTGLKAWSHPRKGTYHGNCGHMPAQLKVHRHLLEATIAYGIFFAFSLLGRLTPGLFCLVMFTGIACPLVWATLTCHWVAIGFTRRNWKQAVGWGSALGVSFAVLFGYSFQRTGNILAPWLAHGIVVIALLITGQLVLYQVT